MIYMTYHIMIWYDMLAMTYDDCDVKVPPRLDQTSAALVYFQSGFHC